MRKLTLAKALQLKNKMVQKMAETRRKINQYNSYVEEDKAEQPYNSQEELESLVKQMENLVTLKTKIHNACEPIRQKIFLLSELKSHCGFIRNLHINSGTQRVTDYDTKIIPVKYVAAIDVKQQETLVNNLSDRIDEIQDELDLFNHLTNIDIDF